MLQGLIFYHLECVLCQCLVWIHHQPDKHHIESEGNTYTACQSCPHAGDCRHMVIMNDIIIGVS